MSHIWWAYCNSFFISYIRKHQSCLMLHKIGMAYIAIAIFLYCSPENDKKAKKKSTFYQMFWPIVQIICWKDPYLYQMLLKLRWKVFAFSQHFSKNSWVFQAPFAKRKSINFGLVLFSKTFIDCIQHFSQIALMLIRWNLGSIFHII